MFDKLSRHADLVHRMAETVGREPAVSDDAGAQAWRAAVLNCCGCSAPGACQAFLDGTEHADAPPSFCRNQRYLADLLPASDG